MNWFNLLTEFSNQGELESFNGHSLVEPQLEASICTDQMKSIFLPSLPQLQNIDLAAIACTITSISKISAPKVVKTGQYFKKGSYRCTTLRDRR